MFSLITGNDNITPEFYFSSFFQKIRKKHIRMHYHILSSKKVHFFLLPSSFYMILI